MAAGAHRINLMTCGLELATLALALAGALAAAPASAGSFGNIELLTRGDNRVLPAYEKDGRRWVIGTPGHEYAIRVCNSTSGRLLAVMSVDGVNVVSGDTASPLQSGYVLNGYECADINGWRKNLSSIAAFYFTELPDSYAVRTGRPDNVGVVGVAFFRERPRRISYPSSPPVASKPIPESTARQEAAGATADRSTLGEGRANMAPSARDDVARERALPAPMAKIGTGHGRQESSYVQTTRFDRVSDTPDETLAIYYDRRENLIAMGIIPSPPIARSSNPFPGWAPGFVPDPPQR
jgi:hypothetical protein